jgi:hypothetical protein
MQKVEHDDHPLSTTFSSSTAQQQQQQQQQQAQVRSPTASLIQSAARSILDGGGGGGGANQRTNGDGDDESDSCRSIADGHRRPTKSKNNNKNNISSYSYSHSHSSSPRLSSLQVETMPALPDEQDRKRFVVSYVYEYCTHVLLCTFQKNGMELWLQTKISRRVTVFIVPMKKRPNSNSNCGLVFSFFLFSMIL